MSKYILPNDNEVRVILGMLFGGETAVKPGTEIKSNGSKGSSFTGTYLNDANEVVGACVCDRAFTVYAGAALSMIPAGGAADVVRAGEISKVMILNLGEVMNILSRTMINNTTPHLRYHQVYDDKEMPADIAAAAKTLTTQKNYLVSIPDYGSGLLSLRVI